MKKNHGFTLIELMVVLMIVAIFMAIAIPSYQQYMRKRDLAVAKQESLRIASELERFKSKNFSYKGFDASYFYAYSGDNGNGTVVPKSYYDNGNGTLYLPIGSTATNAKYILTLVDGDTHVPLTMAKGADNKETSDSQSVKGLAWAMKVERIAPKDPQNYDLLLNSKGLHCMTKTANAVAGYTDCGTSDTETW